MNIRRPILLTALAALTAFTVFASLAWLAPLPSGLQSAPRQSVEFVDRTGKPLRRMLEDQRVYRFRCSLKEISANAIAATLSAEDKRFRKHCGIDFVAIIRAFCQAVRNGKVHSGASTITEQLIKLSAAHQQRGVISKLCEVWGAICLERHWSKDRILEEYLNRLDYGDLQVGLASASMDYFEKPPADLSPAEAAFLAAIPQAPSRLNPFTHFALAKARQRWVLGRMHANGFLDDATYARALVEPLRLRDRSREFEAPLFVDLLLQRRGILPPEGGIVRTTVDLELNQWIERVVGRQLEMLKEKNVTAAAAVVIDNTSGEVLALCGSGNYFEPGTGQINGAWSPRSAGSAIKPFTYVCAMERGAYPGSVVADVPTDFQTETGLYHPNNYNHRFYGPVTLRFALANSLNVAAIKVLQDAGGPETLYSALQRAGITTLGHPAAYYGLGLTIGNGEVRLLELTNAFASLARLGVYLPFRLVRTSDLSDVVPKNLSLTPYEAAKEEIRREPAAEPETPATRGTRDGKVSGNESVSGPGERIFDERAAYLVADMLSDNQARAGTFGLNSYLSFDFPVACKTGTSSNYRDNWTLGFTPEWTVGVWVGNPDNSPMRGVTGVTGAAPIFREIMCKLRDRYGSSWYRPPIGIGHCWIDPLTGHQVARDHPRALAESYAFPPKPAQPDDYDAAGNVRLPAEYQAWIESDQNTLGPLLESGKPAEQLRIIEPAPGSFYYLDPDLPPDDQCLRLRADSMHPIDWSSTSLECHREGDGSTVKLREGRHEIIARDTVTGETASTWIEVERW